MTDLRKAAEMALGALERYSFTEGIAIQALRQALAPKELPRPDEPIWMVDEKGNKQLVAKKNRAQPVDAVNMSQERVDETAKRNCDNCESLRRAAWDRINELEAKLEQREWVGLTDEEVGAWPVWSPEIDAFVRNIEAKLKEKNCG